MAIDPSTHALYVALHDSTAISEIDTQTLTETARFSTSPFISPMFLVLAGGKVWFACENDLSPCVASMNLDGSGLASAGIGSRQPVSLASGGTANDLLATADSDDEPPTLSIYDVSSGTPSLVHSQQNPASGGGSFDVVDQMAFDEPDGSNLLIAAGAPYFVASLTSSTFAPSFEYPTGAYPDAVAVSPDDSYVAAGVDTGGTTDVYLYPTADTTPLRVWAVGGGEVPAHSLAFSPDGSALFVVADNSATGFRDFYVLGVSSPPDTEITGGPSGPTYSTQASFNFSSEDSAATFQCSLDGGPWAGCKSPVNYSGLGTGSHTFKARAVDGSLIDPTGASDTWTINPPDTHLLSGPVSPTFATSASFSFSSDDNAATFECNLDAEGWLPCATPAAYTGLEPGSHTFMVKAINEANAADPVGASQTWVIKSNTPTRGRAELLPQSVLSGAQVTLDASGSHDSQANIVDYRWDLGNGSFDLDSGAVPSITAVFNSTGSQQVRVKVTDSGGDTAIASASVDVRPAPPPGKTGVTIDGGAYATDSASVRLHVVWPAYAVDALISDDGTFAPGSGTAAVPVATTIPWKLASAVSARKPQTVYLRFPTSSEPAETFGTGIVLDTTKPTMRARDSVRTHRPVVQGAATREGGDLGHLAGAFLDETRRRDRDHPRESQDARDPRPLTHDLGTAAQRAEVGAGAQCRRHLVEVASRRLKSRL